MESAEDFDLIIFYNRIREKVPAERVERGFVGGGIQFDFDDFSDADASDSRQSMMPHGLSHGGSLGIKDGKFWHYSNNSLHFFSMKVSGSRFKQAIGGIERDVPESPEALQKGR